MSLSTYSALQTAIAEWLWRTDGDATFTTRAPDFITLCEAQLNKRLRVRQQITRSEATISSEYVSLPTDFLEPIKLTIETSESDIDPLIMLGHDRLLTLKDTSTTTAQPVYFAVVGSELQFLPIPDTSYTAELTYYAKVPALSVTNTSNWLLSLSPDVYLYGSLLQAAPHAKADDYLSTWSDLYKAGIQALEDGNRIPGGKLRTELVNLTRRRAAFDWTRGF